MSSQIWLQPDSHHGRYDCAQFKRIVESQRINNVGLKFVSLMLVYHCKR